MPPTVLDGSSADNIIDEKDNFMSREDFLRAFQNQSHGLRINVSELAACAGFHPYKSLPKVLQAHVYQGIPGQALLRHDAALLGFELVSDEQLWLDLAQKAGKSTQQALEKALQVPTGQTKVASVQAAEALRRKVVQEAKTSKKLSAQEVATLEEGARHSIHTGFGTVWESHALDLYEQQCGWEVTERNAEVRVWDFDAAGQELRPPRPAYQIQQPNARELSSLIDLVEEARTENDDSSSAGAKNKRQKVVVDNKKGVAVCEIDATIKDGSPNDGVVLASNQDENLKLQSRSSLNEEESITKQLPYFSLRGSVDGIRQEMAPIAKKSEAKNNDDSEDPYEDDTTWEFRRVIVECKHRMRRLQPSPPIYEMIQATVYCFMYEAEEADLVQVLRNQQPRCQKTIITEPTTKGKENEEKQKNESAAANKITEYFPSSQKTNPASDEPSTTEGKVGQPPKAVQSRDSALPAAFVEDRLASSDAKIDKKGTKADEATPSMVISVSRISIDDPLLQHRQNWHNIVLPHLQSWTQAVYRVRKDDDKRYRLLTAVITENLQDAWGMLFEESPWLRSCDTSYHRDVASSNQKETGGPIGR